MKGLSLIVVKGPGPSLLGRNWLSHITLDWKSIHIIRQHQGSLKSLLTEFKDVFSEGLGTIDGLLPYTSRKMLGLDFGSLVLFHFP